MKPREHAKQVAEAYFCDVSTGNKPLLLDLVEAAIAQAVEAERAACLLLVETAEVSGCALDRKCKDCEADDAPGNLPCIAAAIRARGTL